MKMHTSLGYQGGPIECNPIFRFSHHNLFDCLFVCVGFLCDGSLNLVPCSTHLCILYVSKYKPWRNISNAKPLFEKKKL